MLKMKFEPKLFSEFLVFEKDFKKICIKLGYGYIDKKRSKTDPLKHMIFLGWKKNVNDVFYFLQTTTTFKSKKKFILLMKMNKQTGAKNIYIDLKRLYSAHINNFQKLDVRTNFLKIIYKAKLYDNLPIHCLKTLIKNTQIELCPEALEKQKCKLNASKCKKIVTDC